MLEACLHGRILEVKAAVFQRTEDNNKGDASSCFPTANQKPRQRLRHAVGHAHQERSPPRPSHPTSARRALLTQVQDSLSPLVSASSNKNRQRLTRVFLFFFLGCLCCCHRDEAGVPSGDEASCNHGGVGVAKRSDSPNTFLDQESRRREEEEPVYCTTPTYGTLLRPGGV